MFFATQDWSHSNWGLEAHQKCIPGKTRVHWRDVPSSPLFLPGCWCVSAGVWPAAGLPPVSHHWDGAAGGWGMSGCSTHRLIMVTPKLMSCGIYSLIYFVFRFTVSTCWTWSLRWCSSGSLKGLVPGWSLYILCNLSVRHPYIYWAALPS